MENSQLKSELVDIRKQLETINQREYKKAAHEKLLEERRIARKNRQRRPLRDSATTPELKAAFSIIDQSEGKAFIRARDKICLLLLYLFGLRSSNLRLITVKHALQLLNNTSVQLPIIKSKQTTEITFPISSLSKRLINNSKKYFLLLIEGKNEDHFLITSEKSDNPISRELLTKRINSFLKKTGKICHKRLTSHSFRIGFTTSIIEVSGIDVAQKFVGHSNISTTAIYSRRQLDTQQARAILQKVELKRQKRITKTYKKKDKIL